MTERPSDEAVERMVALMRKLSTPKDDWKGYMTGDFEFVPDEARAIAAMLPKPVDPAVELVKRLWLDEYGYEANENAYAFRLALAAYRAGQEAGK